MSLLSVSCMKENIGTADNVENPDAKDNAQSHAEGYYISLTAELGGNKSSRTHWDIDKDNNLTFAWDASTDEMKSFVKRGDNILSFIGGIYSPTTVSPDADNKNRALLEITYGLSEEYQDGDVIWAVSPLSDTNISTEDTPTVEYTLPDGYVQTDIAVTTHLKPYVFMTGMGTVSNNSASLSFSPLTAIYRFKITNNDTSTLNVAEVGITGPFCNKVVLGVAGTPDYSVSTGSYTIKVTTGDEGVNIEAGTTSYLYALVFPTATSSIEEDITLYIRGKYGNVPADYSVTAPCKTVYPFDLESNKYYDMKVPVSRQGIEFVGVEIESFNPCGEFDITIDK